jgi:hypothetical protein
MVRYSWDRAVPTFAACFKQAAGRSLTEVERGLLADALA